MNHEGAEGQETHLGFDKDNDDNVQDPDVPLQLAIDGVLDLHTFLPKELPELLDDYLSECINEGVLDVRIIHGKGKGILRDRVRSLLKRHPLVAGFSEAPLDAGGWGATLVELKGDREGNAGDKDRDCQS